MDTNKYLFVFRSFTLNAVYLIGVVVVGYETEKAAEIARTAVWNTTANDVVYGVKVDASVETGICFCEEVEREGADD